jgi:hypothetical protein
MDRHYYGYFWRFIKYSLVKNVPVRILTSETSGVYPSANTGSRRSVPEPFVCVELLLRLLANLAEIAHYWYIYIFPLAYYAYSHY